MFDFFNSKKKKNNNDNNNENVQSPAIERNNAYSQIGGFDEEISMPLYSEEQGNHHVYSYNSYTDNGVDIQQVQKAIRIMYTGILVSKDANRIEVLVGYGNNLKWEDVQSFTLIKIDDQTFEAIIPVYRAGNINVAFKDDADNWDNNEGMNYTFENNYFESGH